MWETQEATSGETSHPHQRSEGGVAGIGVSLVHASDDEHSKKKERCGVRPRHCDLSRPQAQPRGDR